MQGRDVSGSSILASSTGSRTKPTPSLSRKPKPSPTSLKMKASEVQRAVTAATSIAAALDLTVDDAIVLNNSNKLAVRVLPCDVLARVAHVGREVAQFEVDLAQRLAEIGSPVAALEPRVEPRVYERDGFAVTLWTYCQPVAPQEVSSADYANALERLHSGMRKLDVTAPHF